MKTHFHSKDLFQRTNVHALHIDIFLTAEMMITHCTILGLVRGWLHVHASLTVIRALA